MDFPDRAQQPSCVIIRKNKECKSARQIQAQKDCSLTDKLRFQIFGGKKKDCAQRSLSAVDSAVTDIVFLFV